MAEEESKEDLPENPKAFLPDESESDETEKEMQEAVTIPE